MADDLVAYQFAHYLISHPSIRSIVKESDLNIANSQLLSTYVIILLDKLEVHRLKT